MMSAIVYAMFGLLVIQQIIHHYERKDLYNRIMSKNLTEYKGESPGYQVSAHKRVLNRWRGHKGESPGYQVSAHKRVLNRWRGHKGGADE